MNSVTWAAATAMCHSLLVLRYQLVATASQSVKLNLWTCAGEMECSLICLICLSLSLSLSLPPSHVTRDECFAVEFNCKFFLFQSKYNRSSACHLWIQALMRHLQHLRRHLKCLKNLYNCLRGSCGICWPLSWETSPVHPAHSNSLLIWLKQHTVSLPLSIWLQQPAPPPQTTEQLWLRLCSCSLSGTEV